MSGSGAWLGPGGSFTWFFVSDFLLAQPAAPRVVASVDQHPERPGCETGLSAIAGDAALNLHEGVLHGIFGIAHGAEQVAGNTFHSRAMQPIQLFEGAQVA